MVCLPYKISSQEQTPQFIRSSLWETVVWFMMASFVTLVQEPVRWRVQGSDVLRSFVTLKCHLFYTTKIITELHRLYTLHITAFIAFNCSFVLIKWHFCVLLLNFFFIMLKKVTEHILNIFTFQFYVTYLLINIAAITGVQPVYRTSRVCSLFLAIHTQRGVTRIKQEMIRGASQSCFPGTIMLSTMQ